jgi:hypothetical protein
MGGQVGGQEQKTQQRPIKQSNISTITPPTSRLFNARKKLHPMVATTATPPLLTPVAPSPFNARLFIGSTVEQQLPSSYLS